MIATLGDYEFEVSAYNISTFTDLKFNNSAAYHEHKLLSRKGLLEFTGLNSSTCSLTVKLDASFSEDLNGTVTYFYDAMNDGEALLFMVGEAVMGEGFWVIEALDENYSRIDHDGNLLAVDLNIKLKEYLDQ